MVEVGSKKDQSMSSDYWPMLLDYSESYCKKVLRSLELQAYSMVVTALRAQGPLTEAKQSALKELRKLLSITIDRHKAEVRRAVNDEELATISDWICGYSVDEEWVLEGRRVVDVRPRPVPTTVYTDRANHIAERHSKANEQLLSPAQTGNLERVFLPPAPAQQQKSTARKQSHPRPVSSNANSSTPSITSAHTVNQMPIVSKPSSGTVVLNESTSTQSNISQLEYSMMISENTCVNRSSHDSGVVIETLAADIPQTDLIVDSFAEPIPSSANIKQGQSALQPVIDAWSSDASRSAPLQGQNIVLLGRPPFNQDSEHIIKVSGQQIQHLNPQITEVKSLQGIVPQQQQLRPPITQINATRFLSASRVRPIVTNARPEAPTHPSQINQQSDRSKFTVNTSAGPAIRKAGSFIVVPSKGAGKTMVTSGSYHPVKILSSGPIQSNTHCSVTTVDKPITSRSFSAPTPSKQQVTIQKQFPSNAPVDLDSDDLMIQSSPGSSNTVRQVQPSVIPQSMNSVSSSLAYSVTSVPQQIIPKLTLSQLPQETQETTLSVADKRARPVDPPTNWIQMALGFLNRYCISWSEESEVAALANDFTKVKQNLIAGVYPSIREMDADIRNIRLRSLGGTRDNRFLMKKIEDIFNHYDQDYRNLNERLSKISGVQPKRPRYN